MVPRWPARVRGREEGHGGSLLPSASSDFHRVKPSHDFAFCQCKSPQKLRFQPLSVIPMLRGIVSRWAVQIKVKIVLLTKTCKIRYNLSWSVCNNWQSYICFPEICNGCYHKWFPQGLISDMMFIPHIDSRPWRVISSLVADLITLAETHLERKQNIFISLKEP